MHYKDYIELFAPCIFIFLSLCIWQYGIKKSVRNLFKTFLSLQTEVFISKVSNERIKEKINQYHQTACNFIDKYTLQELNEIINCIDNVLKDNKKTYSDKIYDKELENYSKIALGTIFGCLTVCTIMGFISFFFHMSYSYVQERRKESNSEREIIVEKYTDAVPEKEIAQKNPAYVFQSFGEAAQATTSC